MTTIDLEQQTPGQHLTNLKVQRLFGLSGVLCVTLWLATFVWLCQFIPIWDPKTPPDQIVSIFRERKVLIQLGLTLSMFAVGLLIPFSAAITAQLRRIEGRRGLLSTVQMCSVTVLVMEFILCFMTWQTMLYRVETDQDLHAVQMFSDLSWLVFVAPISSVCIQMYAIGACILLDSNPEPVLPRWSGYYNILVGLLIMPASLCVFFKSGPLAWNGLFGIYVPLVAYSSWFVVNYLVLRKAVNQEEQSAYALASSE